METPIMDEIWQVEKTCLGVYGLAKVVEMICNKKKYKQRMKVECEKAIQYRSHCIKYKRIGDVITATYELPCVKNGVPGTWQLTETLHGDPFGLYTENEWEK